VPPLAVVFVLYWFVLDEPIGLFALGFKWYIKLFYRIY